MQQKLFFTTEQQLKEKKAGNTCWIKRLSVFRFLFLNKVQCPFFLVSPIYWCLNVLFAGNQSYCLEGSSKDALFDSMCVSARRGCAIIMSESSYFSPETKDNKSNLIEYKQIIYHVLVSLCKLVIFVVFLLYG